MKAEDSQPLHKKKRDASEKKKLPNIQQKEMILKEKRGGIRSFQKIGGKGKYERGEVPGGERGRGNIYAHEKESQLGGGGGISIRRHERIRVWRGKAAKTHFL